MKIWTVLTAIGITLAVISALCAGVTFLQAPNGTVRAAMIGVFAIQAVIILLLLLIYNNRRHNAPRP